MQRLENVSVCTFAKRYNQVIRAGTQPSQKGRIPSLEAQVRADALNCCGATYLLQTHLRAGKHDEPVHVTFRFHSVPVEGAAKRQSFSGTLKMSQTKGES